MGGMAVARTGSWRGPELSAEFRSAARDFVTESPAMNDAHIVEFIQAVGTGVCGDSRC